MVYVYSMIERWMLISSQTTGQLSVICDKTYVLYFCVMNIEYTIIEYFRNAKRKT